MLLKGHARVDLLDALKVTDDPEAMTQFIHRCRARGVKVGQLLELWDLPEVPKLLQRHALPAADRKALDSQLFGLLLALGEYSWAQIPEDRRVPLRREVGDLFRDDKSSGVHAAAGWLLRQWGAEDARSAQLAVDLDQREVPEREGWEWHTIKAMEVPEGLLGLTMRPVYQTYVLFEPGEHEFGSPADEPHRYDHETLHSTSIAGFWMLDREITRGEWEASGLLTFRGYEKYAPSVEHAILGPNWYDCVRFSRWLNHQLAYGDSQAYADESDLPESEYRRDEADGEGGIHNWPIDLSAAGFRLPTEHEWEAGCRGRTRSAYSFGGDVTLLTHYGWLKENSGGLGHVPRALRPTLRGLFDMQGNAFEWCHDGYLDEFRDVGAAGPPMGSYRVFRGGSWIFSAEVCRSAYRDGFGPEDRDYFLGFRLARSSVEPSPD